MHVPSRSVRSVALVLAAVAVIGLAGCSKSDSDSDGTTTTAKATTTTAKATASLGDTGGTAAKVTIGLGDSSRGKVLTDASGRTLYLYEPDGTGAPTCTGSCAGAWPPVFTTSGAAAGTGVTAKVATVKDADGKDQVTVNGRPVYLFAGDTKPGDSNGQGQGGVWFVLDAAGQKVA